MNTTIIDKLKIFGVGIIFGIIVGLGAFCSMYYDELGTWGVVIIFGVIALVTAMCSIYYKDNNQTQRNINEKLNKDIKQLKKQLRIWQERALRNEL